MRLVDFKVRVIDGGRGTAAKVRVFIESRDQDQIWSTIGVSEDIIEASWQALVDSFQFKLANEKQIRSRKYPAQEELPIFNKTNYNQ
jgi:2-isopropylmalate synthase